MGWQADLKTATAHLARVDAALGAWIDRVGPCRLEVKRSEPFEILIRSVASQQIHAKAAETILARFLEVYHGYFPTPLMILTTPEAVLKAVGFSGSKVDTILSIARGAQDGLVPSRAACTRLSDEALINRLTVLRGVGRWTAEMVLIFGLGRRDVLPTGDFGVREGFRLLHGRDKQPTPAELDAETQHWKPWRTVGTWYLWQGLELSRKGN